MFLAIFTVWSVVLCIDAQMEGGRQYHVLYTAFLASWGLRLPEPPMIPRGSGYYICCSLDCSSCLASTDMLFRRMLFCLGCFLGPKSGAWAVGTLVCPAFYGNDFLFP